MTNCIFCKIANKTATAQIIYEDNNFIAFHDIHPKAEIHFLIIPKQHIESMLQLEQHHSELMGKLMLLANKLAVEQKLDAGYKIQINTGEKGGQEVLHLHLHIVGNR
jgi:histidine triad (HIT) family protein